MQYIWRINFSSMEFLTIEVEIYSSNTQSRNSFPFQPGALIDAVSKLYVIA